VEDDAMIDLYALTSPNVQKVFVMLEEVELPYRVMPVDVWKGEQFKPEFLKLNPNAKIPVIVDHEGPGGKPYTCFESGAILMYLADKAGKLLPKDMAARYDVIQWLMIQMSGIGPASGQLVHFKRFAPSGNDYSLSRYQTEVKRLYEVMEKRLGASAFLGGADYSIADVATFPWTRNHDFLGAKWDDHPNCARWFNAVAERPAVKRALAKVDGIQSARDSAKPEDLDRFFGRGRYARA
jgi:GST-like protein